MKRFFVFLLMSVFLGTSLFVNCAKHTVNSLWADESMTIDGEISEWQAAMMYDEKLDASYGFQNDDEFLYIAIETGNAALQRQLLMRGLVIWVNDTGDKTKDVGFKYPRGLMERRTQARDLMASIWQPVGDDRRLQYLFDHNFRDVQVLDPKDNNLGIYTHKEAVEHDIQFDLSIVHGLMIYELKIPLQGSSKHPWSFVDVAKIGIGFVTPEFDRSQFGRRPMGGDMATASMSGGGGGRGGRGGRGGGMGGGSSSDDMGGSFRGSRQSEHINVWVSATMAKGQ